MSTSPFPGFHNVPVAAPAWQGLGAGRGAGVHLDVIHCLGRLLAPHGKHIHGQEPLTQALLLCHQFCVLALTFAAESFSFCLQGTAELREVEREMETESTAEAFCIKKSTVAVSAVFKGGSVVLGWSRAGGNPLLAEERVRRAEFHESDCILQPRMCFLCSETVVELTF